MREENSSKEYLSMNRGLPWFVFPEGSARDRSGKPGGCNGAKKRGRKPVGRPVFVFVRTRGLEVNGPTRDS